MSAIIKLLEFFFWAGLLPILSGLLVCSLLPASRREFHTIVAAGYLTAFSSFEILGLPILFFTENGNFELLVRLYAAISLILAAAGTVRCATTGGICLPGLLEAMRIRSSRTEWEELISTRQKTVLRAIALWTAFAVLLAFQLYMAYTRAFYDGDDAYYVAQSLQTWQTGTMYHFDPYRGVTTTLDVRHALAMFPMWTAAVARLCGTHPTIVTHSMLPMVFLPLYDICFYSAASALLRNESKARRLRMLPGFMIVVAVMQIFGNVSIYTPETFLIMRTWQGKTIYASMLLPLAFAVLILIASQSNSGEDKTESIAKQAAYFPWYIMALVNSAAGFCTPIAPMMTALLFVCGTFFVSVAVREKKFMKRAVIACLPSLVYVLILARIMLPRMLSEGLNTRFFHRIFG